MDDMTDEPNHQELSVIGTSFFLKPIVEDIDFDRSFGWMHINSLKIAFAFDESVKKPVKVVKKTQFLPISLCHSKGDRYIPFLTQAMKK